MKNKAHILLSAFFTLSAFCSVFYATGCKNKCGNTTCSNGGTCVSNVCVCPTGYYGDGCQSSWSQPYIGTYNCRKSCSPAVSSGSWQSSITAASTNGGYTIYISNFDGRPVLTAYATVNKVDSASGIGNISLPPVIDSGVAGSGKIYTTTGAHDSIVINYTSATQGSVSGYTCTMTMIKE